MSLLLNFSPKKTHLKSLSEAGVEVVIDATGKFKSKEDLSKHIRDSVKKVVLCAPGAKTLTIQLL